MLTQFIKSKTMLFAFSLTVLGIVEANLGYFETVMTPPVYGSVTVAIGVAVAILRILTTVPLAEK